MRLLLGIMAMALAGWVGPAAATDELVTTLRLPGGDPVPYILTTKPGKPAYLVILMPGGRGLLNPRIEDGRIVTLLSFNFLIRTRELFADGRVVAVSTDATTTPERILAIADDVQKRFGPLAVYVLGTSRSTESTLALSRTLDGRVAGFVHSSSMNAIASLDPRGLKSRHLVVLHLRDACAATKPSSGLASHRNYGTDLVEIDGGRSVSDDCGATAHHGYYGVEAETVDRIKQWITAR
jgi:hypothetical protein